MAPTLWVSPQKLSPHHVALVSVNTAVEKQISAISLNASGVGIDRAAPSNYCIETLPMPSMYPSPVLDPLIALMVAMA